MLWVESIGYTLGISMIYCLGFFGFWAFPKTTIILTLVLIFIAVVMVIHDSIT